MSTLYDDPRLTAYALGELPAGEHAEVERLLAGDARLREEVAEIRALSGGLAQELAAELRAVPALSRAQRACIAQASVPRPWRPWRLAAGWGIGMGAAAGLLLLALPGGLTVHPPAAPSPRTAVVVQSEPQPDAAPIDAPALARLEMSTPLAATVIEVPPLAEDTTSARADAEEMDAVQDQLASPGTVTAPGAVAGPRGALSWRGSAAMAEGPARGREEAVADWTDAPPAAADSTPERAQPAYDRATPPLPPAALKEARRADGFRFAPALPEAASPPTVSPGDGTYNQRADHGFHPAAGAPLSTFGLDVDTASYGNVRRIIEGGRLPPRDAVRVEELVNYFPYDDVPAPTGDDAFGVMVEVAPCPWQPAHQLARIAVRAQAVAGDRPPLNLVFLVDVSGSMKPDNRLPLIKTGLSLLAASLGARDRVGIVTYAGAAGVALPSTPGDDQRAILRAVDRLSADGSTNGGSGIELAYDAARAAFVRGGVNRVILCTDGDFNVGITDRDELVRLVQARARAGVFLTVLGVGQDNLKDATMELLADKANGHYHYLDTIAEARKVLVEQLGGTLVTVAEDAKAQVEFNPARIAAWRQLGYEKRQLAARDFNDDRKDGGEVGAQHLVTVLYELVPAGLAAGAGTDGLRYQPSPAAPLPDAGRAGELLVVKLRYKTPDGSTSRLVQGVVTDAQVRTSASTEQRFAAAVAAFALRLRDSAGMDLDFRAIAGQARLGLGGDAQGYRREFIGLVERAAVLARETRE